MEPKLKYVLQSGSNDDRGDFNAYYEGGIDPFVIYYGHYLTLKTMKSAKAEMEKIVKRVNMHNEAMDTILGLIRASNKGKVLRILVSRFVERYSRRNSSAKLPFQDNPYFNSKESSAKIRSWWLEREASVQQKEAA